jgi:hypothetical protein
MKIEVNIDKKYLIILIGVFVLVVGGIFVYAQANGGVSHAWSELTGKPDISNCAGNNQALKTINLETGAVTCEVDDAGGGGSSSGGGGLSSVSWDDITGKPATAELYELGGKVFIFTNSFSRSVSRSVTGSHEANYNFQVRFYNGEFKSRIKTTSTCGNADSGWKTGIGSYKYAYRTGNWGCHKSVSHKQGTVSFESDENPMRFVFTSDPLDGVSLPIYIE